MYCCFLFQGSKELQHHRSYSPIYRTIYAAIDPLVFPLPFFSCNGYDCFKCWFSIYISTSLYFEVLFIHLPCCLVEILASTISPEGFQIVSNFCTYCENCKQLRQILKQTIDVIEQLCGYHVPNQYCLGKFHMNSRNYVKSCYDSPWYYRICLVCTIPINQWLVFFRFISHVTSSDYLAN